MAKIKIYKQGSLNEVGEEIMKPIETHETDMFKNIHELIESVDLYCKIIYGEDNNLEIVITK